MTCSPHHHHTHSLNLQGGAALQVRQLLPQVARLRQRRRGLAAEALDLRGTQQQYTQCDTARPACTGEWRAELHAPMPVLNPLHPHPVTQFTSQTAGAHYICPSLAPPGLAAAAPRTHLLVQPLLGVAQAAQHPHHGHVLLQQGLVVGAVVARLHARTRACAPARAAREGRRGGGGARAGGVGVGRGAWMTPTVHACMHACSHARPACS